MESTFTLAAPNPPAAVASEQPAWFRNRFVGDSAHVGLQWLETAEPTSVRNFSPIVIYGPPDSGKSLLASIVIQKCARSSTSQPAVGLKLKELDRRIRHAFVVADSAGTLTSWESPDVLVWEDAHEATGNGAVDAVLCELLERRAEKQRVTIVCSRLAPWDCASFSPRLVSRLSAGWVIKLDNPTRSSLACVLQAFERHSGVHIPDPTRQWLLQTPRLTIPQLFRWLQMTREFAGERNTLSKRDFRGTVEQSAPTPTVECSVALRIAARELDVDMAGLVSPSRRQSLVRARGIIIVVLRDLFHLTWQEIASWTGRKDHSTVLHAYQKTTGQLGRDRDLEQDLARVVRQIYKQQPLSGTNGSNLQTTRDGRRAVAPTRCPSGELPGG